MSHPDIIFGYIAECAPRKLDHRADFEMLYAVNDSAIAVLPAVDTHPPLLRSMVAVPDCAQRFASFRGERAISVALRGNHLFMVLPQWLDKFESSLLRRTFWIEAEIHYIGEHQCGDHHLVYRPDRAAARGMFAPPHSPPQAWKFMVKGPEGGAPWWGAFPDLRDRPGYREPDDFVRDFFT